MNMKIFVFLALSLLTHAAEVKEKENGQNVESNKDKRQTQDDFVPSHLIYRTARKQEQVAPVEENQEDERDVSRADTEDYRPGQVFSLNPRELLELQPERKAPLTGNQQLQQLYSSPQQEHRQNVQQIYYLEPQGGRQVSLQSIQPSHAVIARPHYSSNGGEASVGAALSVSDSGVRSSDSYDHELFALLGHTPSRQEERPQQYQAQQVPASTQSVAPQYQQVSTQSIAPQYQQVDRYITKPSKKPTKLRTKVHSHIAPPQSSTAPQQYLIETTNVQQQQQQPQQVQQVQQYRPAPQPQRVAQALRYMPVPSIQSYAQQALYERPESQGLKVVAAPKLQQARPQLTYRVIPQYQQPEATPKQYRIVEAPKAQPIRQEQRIPASSIERPVTYLKRFPEPEKMRAVKIYDPVPQEALTPQQPAQIIGEQYFLRPVYRSNEQRGRYELRPVEQQHVIEATKPPHSAIYVSKNGASKKLGRPQPVREQSVRIEQSNEQAIEQQSLEEQRSQLPPPRNNRAYTPEEFAALVAAGYSVTPIPVAPLGHQVAQSRSSAEAAQAPPQRRPLYSSRRHHYLPLRGDDAP